MRTHAIVPALLLGTALAAPPLAGAADRHSSSRHGEYRSSHGDRHREAPPRYRHDSRGGGDHYRHAPRYHPSQRYRYAPGPGYYAPGYRYYAPRYYYRPYPRGYYRPAYPVPAYPYGYYPGGVHGGVHLGVPGFGFSLYF